METRNVPVSDVCVSLRACDECSWWVCVYGYGVFIILNFVYSLICFLCW